MACSRMLDVCIIVMVKIFRNQELNCNKDARARIIVTKDAVLLKFFIKVLFVD